MTIYPDNFEGKIGFDSIKKILTSNCLCQIGIDKVDKIKFSDNINVIKKRIRRVSEFMKLLEKDNVDFSSFFDMRLQLKRIRIEKNYLEEKEIFDLARSLETIRVIHSTLNTDNGENDDKKSYIYPNLHELTVGIKVYPDIINNVNRIVDKYGNIKDSASPHLAEVRREQQIVAASVSRLLNSILKTAKSEGVTDKDLAPTMRDGRLVIPVQPSMKKKIKGIVHDTSDTGRTIYIEPAEVVDANNNIRELEAEEKREIIKILREFSDSIRQEIPDILKSYDFLGEIDFIRAKAKFAIQTNSSEPIIENKLIIDWGQAVHPILQMTLQRHGKKVVPLDIELNQRNRILIISGPNAGGKSVCLKTVGLLQYMLQCGLPVPMNQTSRMGIFKSIFIDIGDEQSIEDDLSTYSSHLLNMKNMLKHTNSHSLILIDEFGSRTEPQIGGAIAEAVLKRLNAKNVFGVITTHYQNLKLFAKENDGVVNGAMLYDRQEMQALFQLQIGNPGSSFAIEIARKSGLPEDVIKEASDIVGNEYINADKYLLDIVRDKRYWESKREAIKQHEKQMGKTIERYETEIEELRKKKKEIIAKAKQEAIDLLKDSNSRIEKTIKEIKEAEADRERTKLVRQQLEDFKKDVMDIAPDIMEEKIQRQIDKLKRRQERKKEGKKSDDKSKGSNDSKSPQDLNIKNNKISEPSNKEQIKEGDYVKIKGQSSIGIVNKINGKSVQLTFGMVIMNVDISRLQKSEPPKEEKRADTFISRETKDAIRDKNLNFHQDIDVRGMRGDEAVQAITYFIDDALVAGVSRVRILHGTGTGILKTLIRQYLSTVPGVSDFKDEHIQLGGAGITVVDLM